MLSTNTELLIILTVTFSFLIKNVEFRNFSYPIRLMESTSVNRKYFSVLVEMLRLILVLAFVAAAVSIPADKTGRIVGGQDAVLGKNTISSTTILNTQYLFRSVPVSGFTAKKRHRSSFLWSFHCNLS